MKFPNEKNNINIEKQQKFNLAKQEVGKIFDKLGVGIENGIKETVAILNAMDIPTSSSCAGHKSQKEGFSVPYVEIYSKAPDGWKEDKIKQNLWKEENLKQKEKVSLLLDEFYKNRKVQDDLKLTFDNIGIFGGFRIQNIPEKTLNEPISSVVQKIILYQNEMKTFTEFLKNKFFEGK